MLDLVHPELFDARQVEAANLTDRWSMADSLMREENGQLFKNSPACLSWTLLTHIGTLFPVGVFQVLGEIILGRVNDLSAEWAIICRDFSLTTFLRWLGMAVVHVSLELGTTLEHLVTAGTVVDRPVILTAATAALVVRAVRVFCFHVYFKLDLIVMICAALLARHSGVMFQSVVVNLPQEMERLCLTIMAVEWVCGLVEQADLSLIHI